MAGSPCPIEVMRQVVERMHMSGVTIAYGMTETSPVSFQSALDDPLERRVSTMGRVQPHLEVRVIDAEGRITRRGVPGELCTRGYAVMLGYWDSPERTAEANDPDGWIGTAGPSPAIRTFCCLRSRRRMARWEFSARCSPARSAARDRRRLWANSRPNFNVQQRMVS